MRFSEDFLNDFFSTFKAEKARSIHGHGEKWNAEKNRVEDIAEMEPDTAIKLIRKNCLRYLDTLFLKTRNIYISEREKMQTLTRFFGKF